MSALDEYLQQLSDHELGSLYNLRINEFMAGTQQKIKDAMDRRGIKPGDPCTPSLPANEIQRLIAHREMCPNCYSQQFFNAQEVKSMTYSYVSVEFKVDYKTCLICLYSEEQESDQSEEFVSAWAFIRNLIQRK